MCLLECLGAQSRIVLCQSTKSRTGCYGQYKTLWVESLLIGNIAEKVMHNLRADSLNIAREK